MPKSIVEPTLEVTESSWVVSAINSDGSMAGATGGGHVMIVVEGLYRATPDSMYLTPFIGQYDILSASTDEEDEKKAALINTKGRYMVRCFEGVTSTRPAGKEYHRFPHKSYAVRDPLTVRQMITAIKAEAALCDRAKRGERDAFGKFYEYPLYQKVGSNHFLTETGMGENCASWCVNYLQMVIPEVAGTKSKPKAVAGKGSCVIL